MKKTVVDIHDLQRMIPFFRSKFGTFMGKRLMTWLSIDKVNQAYANSCHLRGAEFTTALLSDPLIDTSYQIHNKEILDTLPTGAFVTVSNHPIGSLDGVMLIDVFAKLRPDFKVMVNGVLAMIEAMGDNFISVQPDSEKKGGNLKNVNGVRLSLARLKEGHPMGFFPAGGISSYNSEKKAVCDIPWALSIIRLIRKTQVPIYPVYFDFFNSRFFYWLGKVNWRIRTVRIPGEAFNKQGKKADIYIGKPISVEQVNEIKDDRLLADFLYQKTYELSGLNNYV
ncbi:lysophospholipid acyltransferase family protein [Bacteroides sp. 519]|uniref:lysophospholipid acyltransferase family protein n=1 Tax=Bacteroides sp. 519 TaxID=2302937 RepID=UPI0013D1793D|nr:lysophospholipid acyltransferase family protein [Bacteroides sp. 519]NDV58274.1 hemolysin [Bacteroides sp. 519]